MIPILDLSPEIDALWPELMAATERVLKSGAFILGPEVAAFEREVAQYLGVKHAIGVNSGTDALFIALRALGIGPGDEVITTPFSFFATAESISVVGATPVFADIDPETFNLDPAAVEAALTPRTKAIVPVHLFGAPAPMGRLMDIARRHNLFVVEDCAQSFGARYEGGCLHCDGTCGADALKGQHTGTMGHLGAYSFFPSKNLGAFGDGGLVVTNDDALAEQVRMLRMHGSRKKYHNEILGYNSRLDALQAAFLRVKLPHIEAQNAGRQRVAERYVRLLQGVPGIVPPALQPGHVFHQFTVRILNGQRDAVAAKLHEAGVSTMVYYPVPQHRLPVYNLPVGSFPISERAASEVLSLPIWPTMPEDVQDRVMAALRQVVQD